MQRMVLRETPPARRSGACDCVGAPMALTPCSLRDRGVCGKESTSGRLGAWSPVERTPEKRSRDAGTPRRATNPRTGGRPARGTAGTNPRTGQASRYVFTLLAPTCSSWSSTVAGPRLRVAVVRWFGAWYLCFGFRWYGLSRSCRPLLLLSFALVFCLPLLKTRLRKTDRYMPPFSQGRDLAVEKRDVDTGRLPNARRTGTSSRRCTLPREHGNDNFGDGCLDAESIGSLPCHYQAVRAALQGTAISWLSIWDGLVLCIVVSTSTLFLWLF